jgi:hypothetical protein
MTDLDERLRQIERNPSPDLWEEIASRTVGSTPGDRHGLQHRLAAGLVAAVVSIAAFAFLVFVFRSEPDGEAVGTAVSPLTIRVWTTEEPSDLHISASFEGDEIDLVSIETPGPDLKYPNSAPVELPVGAPIVIKASDGLSAFVFELDPAQGEFVVENGSCLIPGSLRAVPGPGETAFFISVEGKGFSGGQAFRAETIGGDLDHDSALDPSATVDATKLGLASCQSEATRPVAEVPIPYPRDQSIGGGIAVGSEAVWIGVASGEDNADGSIMRIDQRTNEIVAEVPIAGPTFRHRVAVTEDAVWAATTFEGIVQRIDPVSNEVIAEIDLGGELSALAANETAVWVIVIDDRTEQDGGSPSRLVRIDPSTNEVVAEVPLGEAATGYEDGIVLGEDAVWVLGSRLLADDREDGGDLVRIDTATNAIAATIPIDGFRMVMAEDGRTIWVRSPKDGVFDERSEEWVWREVDTATNAVSARFSFPSNLDGGLLVVDAVALWSVTYDKNESVVVVSFDPETLAVETMSRPIESYYTDALVDVEQGTAWITTPIEGVITVELSS